MGKFPLLVFFLVIAIAGFANADPDLRCRKGKPNADKVCHDHCVHRGVRLVGSCVNGKCHCRERDRETTPEPSTEWTPSTRATTPATTTTTTPRPTTTPWTTTSTASPNVETGTIPVSCRNGRQHDLIILQDSSLSISRNIGAAKNFTVRLVSAFNSQTDHQVGVTLFGTEVTRVFPLTCPPRYNGQLFEDLINAQSYKSHHTATDKAIDAAISEFETSRGGALKNLLVITDGVSSNPDLTAVAANKAKDMGLRMYALGIGDRINPEEMTALAGGNKGRVFKADSLETMGKLLRTISCRICDD